LPSDFIRLISIGGVDETDKELDYDIEGREILYNGAAAASINIRYIADVTDVNLWDALFRDLMVLRLAMKIVFKLTKSTADVDRINKLYTLAIPSAISIDGQERPPKKITRSRTLASRRGAYTRLADTRYVFED
jgi:hypothetical protein